MQRLKRSRNFTKSSILYISVYVTIKILALYIFKEKIFDAFVNIFSFSL